jgi:hypothetical protein
VTISRLAMSGPGVVAIYAVTGTAPAGATQALLQICVNECGLPSPPAPNDMNFYLYRYTDSANTAFQNFAHGLDGWGIESDAGATASVRLVADATGKSLLFQATAAQQTFVNSSPFAVEPGSTFTVKMQAGGFPDLGRQRCLCAYVPFQRRGAG